MTKYLYVTPVSEPFEMGPDSAGRERVVFNVNAFCVATAAFLEEMAKILTAAAVGTLNTDIFLGSRATPPVGDGPYLSILETGGAPPYHTQDAAQAYHRPSAQIVVRAKSYVAARTMARAAYNAFEAIANTTVTP